MCMQLSSGELVNNANISVQTISGYIMSYKCVCGTHFILACLGQYKVSKTDGMHEYGDPNLTAVRKVLCNNLTILPDFGNT